jgi:uncharacterized LabA/DUF88 family protein
MSSPEKKIAVLIDAENIAPSSITFILDEVAKYGTANVKRIYGDFTIQQMSSWKEMLNKNSIHPMQSFRYTEGKNSSDSALIIDAMDLLYTEKYDLFCIVSSDSDFTRLASRIKESGILVYGIGESKTPEFFRQACNQFITIENLKQENIIPKETQKIMKTKKLDAEMLKLIISSVKDATNEDGKALLSNIGIIVKNKRPDFDYRTYNYPGLMELLIDIGYKIERDNGVPYVKV